MIDFYFQRQTIDKIKNILETLNDALDIEGKEKELVILAEEQNQEGFWNDIKKAQQINKKINSYKKKIKKLKELESKTDDIVQLLDIIEEMNDENEVDGAVEELRELEKEIDNMQIEALLKGKYDDCDAILSLHAGAGGTEAQDWTQMLYRMYTRYTERQGYSIKLLDFLDGDEAGIKSVTFEVSGENAYGYLKAEMGVHRLVRISPFDSNKRRHTSFASLEVMRK